jgi:alkylhydroperoxidase/carboxymuconolactone decarboxylase family protein YurZ
VQLALAAGATESEIVGVLVAVAPTVGLARVVATAPKLADAIGYDMASDE